MSNRPLVLAEYAQAATKNVAIPGKPSLIPILLDPFPPFLGLRCGECLTVKLRGYMIHCSRTSGHHGDAGLAICLSTIFREMK